MDEDARRWDERYRGRHGADPAPPDVIDTEVLRATIPSGGRALDLACGTGAQSLWLAQQGLSVTALDVSPVAIELTAAAAGKCGLGELIEARVADLDDGLPDDLCDLDVIVCQRFRAVDLYGSMIDRLAPGGIGIITVLSVSGAAEPGPFHAGAGELAQNFGPPRCEVIVHREGTGQESVVFRRAG